MQISTESGGFLSLGLFHGVIAQSGSALASYSFHQSPLVNFSHYVYQVGELFGCTDDLLPDVVDCLRKVPFAEFIRLRQSVRIIFNNYSFFIKYFYISLYLAA